MISLLLLLAFANDSTNDDEQIFSSYTNLLNSREEI